MALSTLVFLSCVVPSAQDPQAALVLLPALLQHYERVERELREAAPGLDASRAAARARAIDLLHDYWMRAEFGISERFPGRRQPSFVDDSGRRCAVAFLMDRTGAAELTQDIAASHNHAWVADLVRAPGLAEWLECNGLSVAEAARIQMPMRGRDAPPPPPPEPPPVVPYSGGDVVRQPPAASPRPRERETRTPEAPPSATNTARRAAMARGVGLGDLAETTWVPWFELQSQRWLPARAMPRAVGTVVDVQHVEVVKLLQAALADADPGVRAAATWALGQLGAQPALLRPQLEDAAWQVRCSAIAGLAAVGSAAAVHSLLEVARDDDRQALRPLAVAALAVCRRSDAAADALAVECLQASDDPLLLGAAAAYARVRGADAAQLAAQTRLEGEATVVVRSQLAAAFGGDADADVVATLTRTTSGRGPDARIAGGTGLARTRHALALPALLSAFELEHDLAARIGLLLAIGEHGGDAARDFLLEQAAQGPKALRGWAGLALGVWGRERDDALVAPGLRNGLAREANQSARGEWILGLGLLRDAASRPLLEKCTVDGDSLGRAAAVQALGLLGDAAAQPCLLSVLRSDDCPFVRSAAAAVLAVIGDAQAMTALCERARNDINVDVRAEAAIALGATGDRAAAQPLQELAGDGPAALRAAALRGLGRLFAAEGEPRFAPLAWQAEPQSVPPLVAWLAGMDR